MVKNPSDPSVVLGVPTELETDSKNLIRIDLRSKVARREVSPELWCASPESDDVRKRQGARRKVYDRQTKLGGGFDFGNSECNLI